MKIFSRNVLPDILTFLMPGTGQSINLAMEIVSECQ